MSVSKAREASVLLVDDHPLMRKGLRTMLASEKELTVVGEANDGRGAIDQVRAMAPDVVVMDVSMPGLNGIEATRHILADAPGTRIVALSIHAEKHFVESMLEAGAAAYVLKDSAPEELVTAIHSVLRGETFLSAPILGIVVSDFRDMVGHHDRAEADESDRHGTGDILRTKLHRPALPRDLVPRTALLERLDAGRMRPLMLVSAGAGYGKSVLISSWLESNDWPSAWLSLDEGDSDLYRFLDYFVAAVREIVPLACERTQSLVNSLNPPPLDRLMTCLSNELNALDQPFNLVLDDYHLIDVLSPVNDLLSQLLDHPPIPLHLVILTRRDPPLPLVGLYAKNQITEVRMQDLRFTLTEVRALLDKCTGAPLSEDSLENVHRETEGWVAGLRLLSLALPHNKDQDELTQGLGGGVVQMQEYLVQEVIALQAPEVRDCMLKTSIFDRMCASLCGAMCAANENIEQATEIKGDRFIKTLLDNNLFTISMDDRGEWFRYHHLFQSLLQQELRKHKAPDEIAELHRRASHWLEHRGLIKDAIKHALKSGETNAAAEIFERNYNDLLEQYKWRTVEEWLALLPTNLIERYPALLLAQAWVMHDRYRLTGIVNIIERIETLVAENVFDVALLGELNFFHGALLYWEGNAERSLEYLSQAREQIPKTRPRVRGLLEIYFALSRQLVGQGQQVLKYLDETLQDMELQDSAFLSRLYFARSAVHILSGEIELASQDAVMLRQVSRSSRIAYMEGWSDYVNATHHFRSQNMEAALSGFERLFRLRYTTHTRAAIDSIIGLALTYQALQQPDAATRAVQELLEFVRELEDSSHLSLARSGRARLALAQGDLASATRWLRSREGEPFAPTMFIWLEVPAITQARVMIASGSDTNLRRARELLASLWQGADASHNTCQAMEIIILQSLALEMEGRADAACTVVEEAVGLAEPRGWIQPFVELGQPMGTLLERLVAQKGSTGYLRRILDEIAYSEAQRSRIGPRESRRTAGGASWGGESLTNRELDILELLVQRLQNKEIARRLFVSPETVKTHLKHLYQKLGVSNRRQAAARADEIIAANAAATRATDLTTAL